MMQKVAISEAELYAQFAALTDWQSRYKQLITLARHLPTMDDGDKCDNTLVPGCENRAWLKAERQPDKTFRFAADSEGRIIKGLLTIIVILAQDKTRAEIASLPFAERFEQLKLSAELSQSRQLGLQRIVQDLQNKLTREK